MNPIFDLLNARSVGALGGALVLAAVVYFIGPLIPIGTPPLFAGDGARIAFAVAALLVWAGGTGWAYLKRMRAERGLSDGVAGVGDKAGELDAIGKKLRESLEFLKSQEPGKGGWSKRYLYTKPWYVIIGPPGAGKSTLLSERASGLKFPKDGPFKNSARTPGAAGTRNCDWWFADQAVFLDTAGRWTTRDSEGGRDATEWLGFLDLVKKYRPARPLSGVLVVVPADLLIARDAAALEAAGDQIAARLAEAGGRLRVDLPIYLVISKSDQISGFVEFFDTFEGEELKQVWGYTVPWDGPKDAAVTEASEQFQRLTARINRLELDRLQDVRRLDMRKQVFTFPAAFAALEAPLVTLLESAFVGSQADRLGRLRGVYFTSALQDGNTINVVADRIAGQFGLGAVARAEGRRQEKGIFVSGFFRDLLFPEAGLVSVDRRAITRHRTLRWAVAGASAALVLLGLGLTYWESSTALVPLTTARDTLKEKAAKLETDGIPANKLAVSAVLPMLDDLKAKTAEPSKDRGGLSGLLGFDQRTALSLSATTAYMSALRTLLQPRLFALAQESLFDALNANDQKGDPISAMAWLAAYQAMITNAHPGEWIMPLFQRALSQKEKLGGGELARAMAHAGELSRIGFGQLDHRDVNLINSARGVAQMNPAEAVVERLRRATAEPPQSLETFFGSLRAVDGVIVRTAPTPQEAVISPFFRKERLVKLSAGELEAETKNLAEIATWAGAPAFNEAEVEKAAIQSYLQKYRDYWRTTIDSIQLSPITTDADAIARLNGLMDLVEGTNQTVMMRVLSALADQLRPTEVIPASPKGDVWKSPTQKTIEDYVPFKELTNFVAKDGTPSGEAKILLGSIGRLNRAMVAEASAAREEALSALNSGKRIPQPARAWVATLHSGLTLANASGRKEQLRLAFNREYNGLVDQCKWLIGDSPAPFRGAIKVSANSFQKFFGPDGEMNKFVQRYLRPAFEMGPTSWKRRPDFDFLDLKPEAEQQLRRGAYISDFMFSASTGQPSVSLRAAIRTLGPELEEARAVIGGVDLTRRQNEPAKEVLVQWTGRNGDVALTTTVTATKEVRSRPLASGDWGLIQLFESSGASASRSIEGVGLSLTAEGDSPLIDHPRIGDKWRDFRCPAKLP